MFIHENGTSCVPEEPSHGPQTTLQGKAGCLVAVMDDQEQVHTNATLLKGQCYNMKAMQSCIISLSVK